MQVFDDLASNIHTEWTRYGRDELVFPQLCQSMLERFPDLLVSAEDVLRWLVTAEHLPKQFDPDSKFGNVALTVATRDDFFIQVLIWTDSTTGIHQHGFSGAFLVLHGSSLHSLWSFQECRRWSDRLKGGQLTLRSTEYLRSGSVRPIVPSNAMIHSLFHLESPSITVVVRTPMSAVFVPQLSYERSGLAYDPRVELARNEKLSQVVRMLWTSNHPLRESLSETAMSTLDAYSAVRIILSLRSRPEAQASLIEMWSERDPELAALLRKTVERIDSDRSILMLRKQTRLPRHRMLLALVLNLPDRASIESVLRQILAEDDPGEWLRETICSMHITPAERLQGKSVLGLPLNELPEEALRLLVEGHSVDEAARVVTREHAELEEIRTLCSEAAASPVLAPLLKQAPVQKSTATAPH